MYAKSYSAVTTGCHYRLIFFLYRITIFVNLFMVIRKDSPWQTSYS